MNALPIPFHQALLFDLDGTLANSMALHNQAWITTLAKYNCPVTEEILFQYAGIPNAKTVEIFNQRFGWNLDPKSIAAEKENGFLQNVDKISPIEPVVKIARAYYQKKPLGLVTGGSRFLVKKILSSLDLENIFTVKVCAEDVVNGKPSADPFLLAAKLLKVQPEDCLVFEDGDAGIQGAKAAKMSVVKVTADFNLHLLFGKTHV